MTHIKTARSGRRTFAFMSAFILAAIVLLAQAFPAGAEPVNEPSPTSGSEPVAGATLVNLPDLVVEYVIAAPSRFGYWLLVRIRNQGNATAADFQVGNFSGNDDSYRLVDYLMPGQATTLLFGVRSCGRSGFVYVDWTEQVQEFNESNNSRSWGISCP